MEQMTRERAESLLELARGSAPKRVDPHPCTERCFRIGGPVDLDARGVCPECGWDGVLQKTPPEAFRDAVTPEAVAALAEGWLSMESQLRALRENDVVLNPEESVLFREILAQPARAIPALAALVRKRRGR